MRILKQGAEATIYSDEIDGEEVVVKERAPKRYRLKQIDERLRLARMRQEMKLIRDARGIGVMTPRIVSSDEKTCRIMFEEIDGVQVKDAVSRRNFDKKIFFRIGEGLGRMHSHGIIHGDLTTSNMILSGGDVYFIDFGLGKFSRRVEDMATDLIVLIESIRASHIRILEPARSGVLSGYKSQSKAYDAVVSRMRKIEGRRRYA